MNEWFGESPKELPRPNDAQRARLRELAQEWQPLTQDESDALSTAVREFASKHNITLEEE